MRWLASMLLVTACGAPDDDTTQDPQTTGPTGSTGGTETDSATGSADSTSTSGGVPQEPSVLVLASLDPVGLEVSGLEEIPRFENVIEPSGCAMPACDGNVAPLVGEGTLVVNGAPAAADTTIHVGDRVGVLFGYEDADCNAACGDGRSVLTELRSSIVGSLIISSELPCDTVSSGVSLGVDFYEFEDPGTYSAEIELHDACDEASAPVVVELEVLP